MIINHISTAWRNLYHNKALSSIKIAGLSIGLTVCMLILLYTKDELSFDHFHSKKEFIYRVVQDMRVGKESNRLSVTQIPLGEAFKNEIPEVQEYVRLVSMPATVKNSNEIFSEYPLAVDKNFFSVFSFDLLKGNPATALNDLYSVVLSEDAAKKYFGDTDAMGKVIEMKTNDEFEIFTVTGIAKNPPLNSTIRFELLVPFEFYRNKQTNLRWIGGSLNTFLELVPQADATKVEKKMQDIFDKNTSDQIAAAEKEENISIEIKIGLQPLVDIHLNNELGAHNGLTDTNSPLYSFVLICIAIFILLIACINFINLSIGQSLKRSCEIGLRKAFGGNRWNLIGQFLTETFLVSLFAFVLATLLTFSILPIFNNLAEKNLSLSYLTDGWLYTIWFLLLMVTLSIAGFYPSYLLSGFQPAEVLFRRQILSGRNYFSRGLIVFQFSLAIFLLIAAIAIYTQLNFLFNQKLGYESTNLLKIDVPFTKDNAKLIVLKDELSKLPGIENTTARNSGHMRTGVWADTKQILIDFNKIDENYFRTFNIALKEGRNFSTDFPSDEIQSAIVNENFLINAGWTTENAIGKNIRFMEGNKSTLTIIGVISDYHFESLKEKITPQLFSMGSSQDYGQIWVKIKPYNIPLTLTQIAETFKKVIPLYPYSFVFMDALNARNYENETRWKEITGISALLFIFISCIGMLGLVMLSVEQRTKEIGVRRVLGAEAGTIFLHISAEFTSLIGIALLIATPVGYFAVDKWLQNFAVRTNIQSWMYILAGFIVIVLAFSIISYHVIKAARRNPVSSLRME